MYNTPNYTEQGGAKTVIGGEIDVTGTLKLKGKTVTQAANQIDSTASTVSGAVADMNALLAKFKAVGLMAADA